MIVVFSSVLYGIGGFFSLNTKFLFFKGRVALYAILKSLNIGPGDKVVLPGFTCIVVPNAVRYVGATPVYVDIDPKTFNIDISKIDQKSLSGARAIVVQHTFGIPADVDSVKNIASPLGCVTIEDSCQALGSKYKGKEVGASGDFSFFSSQWSKPVTTGLGGWAVVNNPEFIGNMERIYPEFDFPSWAEVFELRVQYFMHSILFRPALFWFLQELYRALSLRGIIISSSSIDELEGHMPLKYAKSMSRWQKSILLRKLQDFDRHIEHRKWVVSMYEKYLENFEIDVAVLSKYHDPVFLRYPVVLKRHDKQVVLQHARRAGIELGDWFLSPVHPNCNTWGSVGYERGMCPIAESVCERIVNLPCHIGVGEKYVNRVADFLSGQGLN